MDWTFVAHDVLIASKTPDNHQVHLHLIFERFVSYGILINPSKCVLGAFNNQSVTPLP